MGPSDRPLVGLRHHLKEDPKARVFYAPATRLGGEL